MNQDTRKFMKNDKAPQKHHFFTNELIRRRLISSDNEFDLYLFDALFENLLQHYEFNDMIIAVSYTISCIKRNKFKDENGLDIDSIFAYFKVSLTNNLRRLTTPVYIDWLDDD